MDKKSILRWGFNLIIMGLVMIALVAIVFNIMYGWHWDITNPIEKNLDRVAQYIFRTGVLMVIGVCMIHTSEQIEKEKAPRKPRAPRKVVEKLD